MNKDFLALILKKNTVYNNLEKLRTKGIIIRDTGSGGNQSYQMISK